MYTNYQKKLRRTGRGADWQSAEGREARLASVSLQMFRVKTVRTGPEELCVNAGVPLVSLMGQGNNSEITFLCTGVEQINKLWWMVGQDF